MIIKNPKTQKPYWDEGQTGELYHWYKKGFWKRQGRKKWIKDRIKELNPYN